MPECGSKCPAFYGIDCSFNPDAVRQCELPFREGPGVSPVAKYKIKMNIGRRTQGGTLRIGNDSRREST